MQIKTITLGQAEIRSADDPQMIRGRSATRPQMICHLSADVTLISSSWRTEGDYDRGIYHKCRAVRLGPSSSLES
jgi:hypothetical protein